MTEDNEQRVREIFWEELSGFLHELEIEANGPAQYAGDTATARGLLRLLFIKARLRQITTAVGGGDVGRVGRR